MTSDSTEVRDTEQGRVIDVKALHGLIRAALEHEAVHDEVNELLVSHVVELRNHPWVIAACLKDCLQDLIASMTVEDWRAVTDEMIADVRATVHSPYTDPEPRRRK